MLLLCILFPLLLRVLLSVGPHSGQGVPPMFGDFEAQRHWSEITLGVELKDWYSFDVGYWGLDYPPLTAYHSYFMGRVVFEEKSIELNASRGREDGTTKIRARFATWVTDLVVFFPAVVWGVFRGKPARWVLLVLTSPALVLIDHGHYQFNCAAHGLVVWAVAVLSVGKELSMTRAFLGSLLFCLALNFKQMTLYYAPAFFVFLLKWALDSTSWVRVFVKLVVLGTAVVVTFLVLWLPFVSQGQALQVLSRIFPFERGLFEDKVANFWCASNTFIKWKTFDRRVVTALSLLATLSAIAPSCINVMMARCHRVLYDQTLLWCLFNVSLGFFLFSFQVHEKSVLLPLIPALLLVQYDYFFAFWFSVFSAFSMIPLLVKDRLVVSFFSCMIIFVFIAWRVPVLSGVDANKMIFPGWLKSAAMVGCTVGSLVTTMLVLIAKPPGHLPDLYVVIHESLAFVILYGFFVYGNAMQLFPRLQSGEALEIDKPHSSSRKKNE